MFEHRVTDPVLLSDEPKSEPKTRAQRDKLSRIWLEQRGVNKLVRSGFHVELNSLSKRDAELTPSFAQAVEGVGETLVLEPFVARAGGSWLRQVKASWQHFHYLALAIRAGEVKPLTHLAAYMLDPTEKQADQVYGMFSSIPEVRVFDTTRIEPAAAWDEEIKRVASTVHPSGL